MRNVIFILLISNFYYSQDCKGFENKYELIKSEYFKKIITKDEVKHVPSNQLLNDIADLSFCELCIKYSVQEEDYAVFINSIRHIVCKYVDTHN